MNLWIFLAMATLITPAFGQTMYKCPDESGVIKFQQMPCTPTGGGESVPIKPIKSTGSTLEINEQGRSYMAGNKERWEQQAADEKAERERAEALRIERAKVRAAEEQAAAQRATAAAIWASGRRW